MINLHVTRAGDYEGAYLRLPVGSAKTAEFFSLLDCISTDTASTRIVGATSAVYNLSGYIKSTDIKAPGELAKLNTLAERLRGMDKDNILKFEGMLDANCIDGVDDVLRLTDALDEYILLPDVSTYHSMGKYLVEKGVMQFPEYVLPYLDYAVISTEFCVNYGGAFCRGGYVVQRDTLPKQLLADNIINAESKCRHIGEAFVVSGFEGMKME